MEVFLGTLGKKGKEKLWKVIKGTARIQVVVAFIRNFQDRFVSRAQDPNDGVGKISLNTQVQKITLKVQMDEAHDCFA